MSSQAAAVLIIVTILAVIVALLFALRSGRLQRTFQERLREELDAWRQNELNDLRRQLENVTQREATVALEQWKVEHTAAVRQDAIQRSQAVTAGKVFEQLVPYLPGFQFNPKDARFLGTPVDFLVFDGLADDECDRVVFVEVKTGASSLSTRERRVRDAIKGKRVVAGAAY
jgi:predicted Holliday junction resolvase-like endonuclease